MLEIENKSIVICKSLAAVHTHTHTHTSSFINNKNAICEYGLLMMRGYIEKKNDKS